MSGFPDLSEPFRQALQLADSLGGTSSFDGTSGSTATAEKSEYEEEVEKMLLEETKHKQLEAYRADIMTSWLLKRSKQNPDRYRFFGTNPSHLAGAIEGNLQMKGTAEDRLVVLTELISILTGSEDIAGAVEITQKAFEKEAGAGKYSPYLKELYAAGLGLDGITDETLANLLEGKKFKGKTYTLKDIAQDQRFIIDAHKRLLNRKESLNGLVEDFSYAKLGLVGKFGNFNWFSHQFAFGTPMALVGYGLNKWTGLHATGNYCANELAGISDDVIKQSTALKYLAKKSYKGGHWASGISRWLGRNGFHSRLIGTFGREGAESVWIKALKQVSSAASSATNGTMTITTACRGFTKDFAVDKVDDAAKFLIKNCTQNGGVGLKAAGASVRSWGLIRGFGKGVARTLLGKSFYGIAVAAGIGALITAYNWSQERGGLKPAAQEISNRVYDFGKNVLGPLDLMPDYGSWTA
jgi:hypothetical protein